MKTAYRCVTCHPVAGGFAVLLDETPARTPLGNLIILPTLALAEIIAAEWRASMPSPASARGQGEGCIQGENALTPIFSRLPERELKGHGQREKESKNAMRLTAIACIAIDLGESRRDALIDELVGYGDTDLVCYRAANIPQLEAEQETLLGPVIRWAAQRYALELRVTGGLMPIRQPEENRMIHARTLAALDAWQLAVVAIAAKALGSVILALMLHDGAMGAQEAFALAHLEENYETGKWGPDSQKDAAIEHSRQDILAAERFLQLLR